MEFEKPVSTIPTYPNDDDRLNNETTPLALIPSVENGSFLLLFFRFFIPSLVSKADRQQSFRLYARCVRDTGARYFVARIIPQPLPLPLPFERHFPFARTELANRTDETHQSRGSESDNLLPLSFLSSSLSRTNGEMREGLGNTRLE